MEIELTDNNWNPGIILQARLTSSRFPNKVLHPLLGKPILEWMLEACYKSGLPTVLAIPDTKSDAGISSYIKELVNRRTEFKIKTFRGPLEDVLYRFVKANELAKFDPIVRLCADSPLTCAEDINLALNIFKQRGYFTMLNHVQVFSKEELIWAESQDPRIDSRQHVVRVLHHTVDYPEDIDKITNQWENGSPTMNGRKALWGLK